jgi:thiol:disulfide interchange protein
MQGLRNYLQLKAQSKTGLSAGLLVWALIGMFCAAATLGFVVLAVFIWLAERYGALNAALVLGGFFFAITVIAVGVTMQVSRAIGWRKLAPLLAVGVLAAGLGMQWYGRTSDASTKPRLAA